MRRFSFMAAIVLVCSLYPQPASRVHASWRPDIVPPGWPKVLSIPKLGVRANVEAVDMTHKSDIHAPYKWGDVAWYSAWSRPGEPGRAQIYGHLDSYCCPAVFWHLRDLRPGDRTVVQYPNGKSLTFQVRWSRIYPHGALPEKFMLAQTQERGLLLITCAGTFHRDGTGYDHRIVVYATLVVPGGIALPSLHYPLGAAVDARGNVYVADAGNSRIAVFDARRRALRHWGKAGSGIGEFKDLSGIAVAPDGSVYAADSGNHRVQKFSSQGKPVAQWGPAGSVKLDLSTPTGVAVDRQGNVYVTDSDAGHIVKLSPEGQVLATWGRQGHALGQFWYPDAVAVAPNGTVYVADSANGRVEKLAADGTPLKAWRVKGSHKSGIAPEGIAVDAANHVYVVSPRYNGVLRYSSSGSLTAHWGQTGTDPGRLRQPNGVAVDAQGNVYVTDSGNDRVQEFSSRGAALRLWW